MNAPVIRATGLTKRFGSFTAVDDLSFEVAPGSIFAFLGANGSGKSTTIRMLIGLLTPTAGAIEVDGIDVVTTPRRVRDHIGYMGQRVSLYQGLSLRENLEFYAGLYDIEGAELERRWSGLCERFALGEAEHEKAADLPAGVRQRAGLALSTLHRPRVLFLDEPTAGVDVENRLRFWELIQEEAAGGVTVFVTTHFLEEVDYCDWVCLIDAGRLVADASPETIRRRCSPGYRIRLDLAPAQRTAAATTLDAAGVSVAPTTDGLTLTLPTLAPAVLRAVAAVGGRGTDGRLHVEQPAMSDVFRQLLSGSAAGAPALSDHPAPADAPIPAPATAAAHTPAAPSSPGGHLAARWRRLRTLMRREVRATLRDAFTVTILIAVPIAALLTFGYTLSVKVHRLPIGVHDASGTSASRRLIAELAAGGSFAPRRFATRAALDRAMISGAVSAAIVIPPDFDRALGAAPGSGRAPQMQVLYDGGETVVAGNAEAFLQSIVAANTGAVIPPPAGASGSAGERSGGGSGRSDARTAPGGVAVVSRALFNPQLDGTPFMVAGTYGFVLTFLTTLITAVSVVGERLSGTFEQLQVTPATSAEIVLGKILPLGAVFALDVVLMMLVAGVVLGVWPAGNALLFVAVAGFYVLVSLALGLIFSATSATAAAAVQKTVLFSIPLNFLGGFLFPIRNMPLAFRWLSELLPATHFIAVSRAIYLRAEGPLALLPELGLLALFGVALMAIAFRTVAARA